MKKSKLVLLLLVAIVAVAFIFNIGDSRRYASVMFAGADAVAYQEPRIVAAMPAGPPQPKVSPAEAGIDMAGIQAAVDYAGARNTRALVIGHGGHIVFEKYWGDTTLDTSRGPVRIHAGAERARARRGDERRAIDQSRCAARRIHCRMGRRSARRDQPASVAHALERLCERDGWPWPGTRASRYALSADLRPVLLDWPLDAALKQGESPAGLNADILALALACRLGQPFDKLLAERLWRPIGAGDSRWRAARVRAAAFVPGSATGCASARCWPTMACSRAIN